jgi:hypothetical protein
MRTDNRRGVFSIVRHPRPMEIAGLTGD